MTLLTSTAPWARFGIVALAAIMAVGMATASVGAAVVPGADQPVNQAGPQQDNGDDDDNGMDNGDDDDNGNGNGDASPTAGAPETGTGLAGGGGDGTGAMFLMAGAAAIALAGAGGALAMRRR